MAKCLLGVVQLKSVYSDVQAVTFDLKQTTDKHCTLNRSGDVFATNADHTWGSISRELIDVVDWSVWFKRHDGLFLQSGQRMQQI